MNNESAFFVEPTVPRAHTVSDENIERIPEDDIVLENGTVAIAYKNNSEPKPEITHFDPYWYGEYDEYDSSKPKPLSKMTLKDALLIVCGQARASDFHDEVVEQACQMIENAHLIPPTKKD